MGLEIGKKLFKTEDHEVFAAKLRAETDLVQSWFADRAFSNNGYSVGYELEFWLVRPDGQPAPVNTWFLKRTTSKQFVPELSRFNVELNGSPEPLQTGTFQHVSQQLQDQWVSAQRCAHGLHAELVAIGILPTLTPETMTLKNMSPFHRYRALNHAIMEMRNQKPFHININGEQKIDITHPHLMAAAAATSLQIHLKVPADLAVRAMNAATVASSVMAALTANSPFLFGRNLWHETRVPLFEQTVDPILRDSGKQRRTLFANYLQDSFFEPFAENIALHPTLLPMHVDSRAEELRHLSMHNGTVWRWNRPIIGFESDGTPHLRIEHRVPAAGPSRKDVHANIFFFIGLVLGLCQRQTPIELEVPQELVRRNFYQAARNGLDAEVTWRKGQKVVLRELILNELLEDARQGLAFYGEDPHSIDYLLNEIIAPRALSGQTGSQWLRHMRQQHKLSDAELLVQYIERQKTNEPVHKWKIG